MNQISIFGTFISRGAFGHETCSIQSLVVNATCATLKRDHVNNTFTTAIYTEYNLGLFHWIDQLKSKKKKKLLKL